MAKEIKKLTKDLKNAKKDIKGNESDIKKAQKDIKKKANEESVEVLSNIIYIYNTHFSYSRIDIFFFQDDLDGIWASVEVLPFFTTLHCVNIFS